MGEARLRPVWLLRRTVRWHRAGGAMYDTEHGVDEEDGPSMLHRERQSVGRSG